MKRVSLVFLPFFCVILSCMGCRSSRTITREITVKDTVVSVMPDSATLSALIACDSNGRVMLRELETARGRNTAIVERWHYDTVTGAVRWRVVARTDTIQVPVTRYRDREVVRQVQTKQRTPWRCIAIAAIIGAFVALVVRKQIKG